MTLQSIRMRVVGLTLTGAAAMAFTACGNHGTGNATPTPDTTSPEAVTSRFFHWYASECNLGRDPIGSGAIDENADVTAGFRQACEDSLRRLNTDWIDLYQFHFPDPLTPIEETLRALDDLIRAGKVRYIGNSNMSGWQVVEAEWTSRSHNLTPFVSAQNEYNLLDRRIEKELLPACEQYGLGILPYFPLASGLLTGKYHRGEAPAADTRIAAWGTRGERMLSDKNFVVVEKLEAFAKERGKTLLDLAFSWLASHDFIPSVIAGATKPELAAANAAAAEWTLTPEEMAEVDTITAR